mgnify:CR=1 FL=1
MKQAVTQIRVQTRGKGLYPITGEIARWVACQKLATGLLTVFVQHTSASLVVQENADPDVVRDLDDFFERIAPENDALYRHTIEGPDDMPAHVKTALTQTTLTVPVASGKLMLGTWQGIYLFEHRRRPHARSIVVHVVGE